jgi:hypothetical protein
MRTFQDFQKTGDRLDFIRQAIVEYRGSETYQIAVVADEYERQRNRTITQYVKYLYDATGRSKVDTFSSNNRIASNFFHRLNTQRCAYSLGNGVTFAEKPEIKDALGTHFDNQLYSLGYNALIHGVSYGFWNKDKLHVFPATEFCPLWDEKDGSLRAGIRFWSLDWERRPVTAVLYEEDGYTKYQSPAGSLDLREVEAKQGYIQKVARSAADGDVVIGETNYSSLPIIPLWGSKHRQSTLVGMRDAIDSYDLIQSGFANDLQDCAQIYWLIGGNSGMEPDETQRFLDRLTLQHVANVDDQGSSVTPYTQEIPTQARATFLDFIRQRIYEDFGALNISNVSASAKTATEIDAAYEPMDEEADDFEYQVIMFIQQLLTLIGEDDVPVFKRNRVSNQSETVTMLAQVADHLDERTFLAKLPFLTVDEVENVLVAKDGEESNRLTGKNFEDEQEEEEPEA